MKKLKRILAVVLTAALMATCLVACGKEGETKPDTTTPDSTGAKKDKPEDTGSDEVVIWVFCEPHHRYYDWVCAEYTKEHPDVKFKIEEMEFNALHDRLAVIISAGGEGTPDLIDMEQSCFPLYMSKEKMFMEPLTSRMKADGILDKIVPERLSLYSYNGEYYGLEHALCPVTMAYRPDLFESAGTTVPSTWDEYKAAAEKLADKGVYICASNSPGFNFPAEIEIELKACDSQYVDKDGNPFIAGNTVLRQLLDDYLYMVNNDMIYSIENDAERWDPIAADQIATYMVADWAAGWLKDNVPEQSGKWKMAALPKIDANSSRTSCNGGTGCCMSSYTKKDKDMLWDFMKFAMVDTDNCVQKFEIINLYPAVYEAMPKCSKPVDYYGGQVLGDLYAELAPEMPTQNQASWRGKFYESYVSHAYDWTEGTISTDEFLQLIQKDVDDYIAAAK